MDNKIMDRANLIVTKEIESCISSLIFELAQNEKYWEDLSPGLSKDAWECSKCGADFNSEDDADSHVQEKHDDVEYSSDVIDQVTNEAYEHWLVSSWLFDKLEGQGELVVEFMGLKIWGRCTSGQAISYDGVIQRIAKEAL